MYETEISAFMGRLLETKILMEEIHLKTVKGKRWSQFNVSESKTNGERENTKN